jgi:uncharacterized membrane protein
MKKERLKEASRILLGAALAVAGTSHLSFARKAFQAQVPDWVPLEKDDTVVYSGLVEIALGAALVFAKERHRKAVGELAAIFFAAVFPGNISQWVNKKNSFGLDSDKKRLARLFFQPALIYWALASTGKQKDTSL